MAVSPIAFAGRFSSWERGRPRPHCSIDAAEGGRAPREGRNRLAYVALVTLLLVSASAAESPADRMTARYFEEETTRVTESTFADIRTLSDWTSRRATYREELLEMLGLSPLPAKTDLKATVTGRVDKDEFHVENVHFQSLPGLYATANLYVPKNLPGRAPAILYVCGHANVKQDGVSYGAKAHYQHHGAWFARQGYVCLVIDTIQLGELEGLHHGTHREGMWWWNARGYTPGGVEAWNAIRALDYLQSRPEVDGEKIGMTGRSGGGAYTWITAALDERVKVAVPVAGMTDLRNYVVDGCVTGHCDCMFTVNTYRWDYAKVAALLAPRPLLFSNTDKDTIFPLDGVQRTHRAVAAIYQLHNAADKLGLLITEGPHKDTQDLQVPAIRWFNRFLKGEDKPITIPAEKLLTPRELKVFTTLPTDQRTTKIHETFVPLAAPAIPADRAEWERQRTAWRQALRTKAFGGWPATAEALQPVQTAQRARGEVQLTTWEFTSQGNVRLPLVVLSRGAPQNAKAIHLHVADEADWNALVATHGEPGTVLAGAANPAGGPAPLPAHLQVLHDRVQRGEIALAYLPPRGIGPTATSGTARDQIQIRRRYMLLGQTLDGMRVWDIQRAVAALRQSAIAGNAPLHLHGARQQAVNVLYSSLFTDGIAGVEMVAPPASHAAGPDYLNVLRYLDIPQAAAMAAERAPVKWTGASAEAWSWTTRAAKQIGLPADRLQW